MYVCMYVSNIYSRVVDSHGRMHALHNHNRWRHELKFVSPSLDIWRAMAPLMFPQISLQHLPTMQAEAASGASPRTGRNQMLSGLFAAAQTQATGLLAKVRPLADEVLAAT